MDENHPSYSLRMPGEAGSESLRLPPRRDFPPLDEHLVEPEVTRDEIVGGRRLEASPAEPPHAIQHGELDYVVRAHVRSGYRIASDLLTRFDRESDFASDTAVLKEGTDPETGGRHLEEIAFEVVSTQSPGELADRARRMHRRGVRRIFAVFVKGKRVAEWSPEDDAWRELEPIAAIEDPVLIEPLAVAALVDAAAADDAVVDALAAKGNPALRRLRRESEARAKAEAVLGVLEARGLEVDDDLRRRISTSTDLERLDRWLRRAAVAGRAEDVDDDD